MFTLFILFTIFSLVHHVNKFKTFMESKFLLTFVAKFENVEFTRRMKKVYPHILLGQRSGSFRDSALISPPLFGKQWVSD